MKMDHGETARGPVPMLSLVVIERGTIHSTVDLKIYVMSPYYRPILKERREMKS
jgi:hypothetical protein